LGLLRAVLDQSPAFGDFRVSGLGRIDYLPKVDVQSFKIVTERVTLITGASAGIGTELARVFAAGGHRVALTARRADRLNSLAIELRAKGSAAPIVIPCDLEQPNAADKIAAQLTAAGVEVEYLVNNAGFGLSGRAIELDRAEQLGIITVNIRAMTDLCLRFADSLIRHQGGILNISSIAGFVPGPGMAVYYASKAYVLSLSEALSQELAARGVRVTVLCPGVVHTEFQARAGLAPDFDAPLMRHSPADVARAGYRGLMAGKRIVLPGLGVKLVPPLLRLFPRSFVLRAVGRFQLPKR
jgi:uncharacterized protein